MRPPSCAIFSSHDGEPRGGVAAVRALKAQRFVKLLESIVIPIQKLACGCRRFTDARDREPQVASFPGRQTDDASHDYPSNSVVAKARRHAERRHFHTPARGFGAQTHHAQKFARIHIDGRASLLWREPRGLAGDGDDHTRAQKQVIEIFDDDARRSRSAILHRKATCLQIRLVTRSISEEGHKGVCRRRLVCVGLQGCLTGFGQEESYSHVCPS